MGLLDGLAKETSTKEPSSKTPQLQTTPSQLSFFFFPFLSYPPLSLHPHPSSLSTIRDHSRQAERIIQNAGDGTHVDWPCARQVWSFSNPPLDFYFLVWGHTR